MSNNAKKYATKYLIKHTFNTFIKWQNCAAQREN